MTARLSIADSFARCKREHRLALMPFIAAGYPSAEVTRAVLPALEAAGADLIEIGIPFSDPIADGPVIQQAFGAALAAGVRVADVFDMVAAARPKVSIPLIAMVSYSIVFRFGSAKFFSQARESGFDGLIIPDLPPPEAQAVCGTIRSAGLDTVLLVAPTTRPARRAEVARLCTGFTYYLSVSGITGERSSLPADLAENVRQLKSASVCPVAVGFGIGKPEHVAALKGIADGAIVGSALVRRMAGDNPVESAATLVRELRAAC